MQSRTLLQGLIALPFIGLAAKAVAKDSDGLYPWQRDALKKILESDGTLNIPIKQGPRYFIQFDKSRLDKFVDIKSSMFIRKGSPLPTRLVEQADVVVDLDENKVLKNRSQFPRTEERDDQTCLWATSCIYFHPPRAGSEDEYGVPELTREVLVKNKLTFYPYST